MLISKDDIIFVAGHNGMVGSAICMKLKKDGYKIKDINTEQSSLEEIFIKLIQENNNELVRN